MRTTNAVWSVAFSDAGNLTARRSESLFVFAAQETDGHERAKAFARPMTTEFMPVRASGTESIRTCVEPDVSFYTIDGSLAISTEPAIAAIVPPSEDSCFTRLFSRAGKSFRIKNPELTLKVGLVNATTFSRS